MVDFSERYIFFFSYYIGQRLMAEIFDNYCDF